MRAPLQLENSFFLKVCVEANAAFAETKHEPERDADFSLKLERAAHPDDPNRFQIVLSMDDFRAGDAMLPYAIDVRIAGFFYVAPGFDHEHKDHLLKVNGATMLYGAVREHILGVTGRGPFGPYHLPAISFAEVIPRQEPQQSSDSAD